MLVRRETNPLNPYSLGAFIAMTIAIVMFLTGTQQQDVTVIGNSRISNEMIAYLSILGWSSLATIICVLAIYKTQDLLTRIFLVVVLLVNFWVAGMNIFIHLLSGGFEHYRFATVTPPDPSSEELKMSRSELKQRQDSALKSVSGGLGYMRLADGYVDVCMQGSEAVFNQQSSGYANKCVYRTNV